MFPDQIDWNNQADLDHWLHFLRQKLNGRYRHVDEHLLNESIADALMHYKLQPNQFDASRSPLTYYLKLWTRSYLDLKWRKEGCRRRHEKAAGVSDKIFEKILSETRHGKCIYIGKDRTEQEREEAERQQEVLDALKVRLNSYDRAGIELMLAGASDEEWVRHLGIEPLPESEQKRRINREKERLRTKLRRWAQKIQGEVDPRTKHPFGQRVLTQVENGNHGGSSCE